MNDKNNEKLLKLLQGVEYEKRTAKFVCCIACVFPDGRRFSVIGECHGHIAEATVGTNGFGYDPVFMVNGKSFAELSAEEKDKLSHRGKSLALLSVKIKDYMSL